MNVRTMRMAAVWLLVIASALAATGRAADRAAAKGVTLTDVKIPMRDGVVLSANIFLPSAEAKFPVILSRTPYNKAKSGGSLPSQGYVVVSQDCRGKGQSAGTWVPFIHERSDGQDTIRWIARQPWCNGSIGMMGGSYVGFTQWSTAPVSGDLLRALFTTVPLIDPYDDLAYVGGAFQLRLMMGWGSSTGGSKVMAKWQRDDWLRTLPLRTWDTALDLPVPYLQDWIAHPQYDDYWKPGSIRGQAQHITTPIFAVCGWYDIFAGSVIGHLNAVREQSPSPEARKHQHLLMGPWPHGANRSQKLGDLDFGKDSLVDMPAIQSQWFDRWLKQQPSDVDSWPPFRIFVMGRNQWRDEQEWPLARTKFTPYYFQSGGSANTAKGNGRLTTDNPATQAADRFVYDPDDPVPTLGGCLLGGGAGPYDQSEIEQRPDVLVFTGDPLASQLEVTGPVKVLLYAATTAPDTDWTAKLVDVWPDGRAINLCDGIVRARCRDRDRSPSLIEPGKVYRYEIDLWVTSNVFLPGHRIRVEVSSSNFSRFDRNPNTGHAFGADAERCKATQTVFHDAEHPSHILLPVIP
jgi:putative CocE/NonD family hydrolase